MFTIDPPPEARRAGIRSTAALTTDEDWNAAVTADNQSRSYARQVADQAEQGAVS